MQRSRTGLTSRAIECLEPRLVLTWPGVPPATIPVPISPVAVVLDAHNDASGAAAISSDEIDYYSLVAPSTGVYEFATGTPTSSLDTVIGVFNSAGRRLASNDDGVGTTDSRLTVRLSAGTTYYFGITNDAGSPGGAYGWSINGPDDDGYEQNDTFAAAKNLGPQNGAARTYSGLQLRDDDWFRFTTQHKSINASDTVSVAFQHAQGNLDLELYDASGRGLRASRGTTDSETIRLSGLVAGTYYVRVLGASGAQNPNYQLTIQPPDDDWEQNDSMGTAADLGTLYGDRALKGLQLLDADWFRFTPINDGVSVYTVRLDFLNNQGNIDMELYDSSGALLTRSASTLDYELITLPPGISGPVSVRVFIPSGFTNQQYSMQVTKDFPDDEKEENDKPSKAYNLGTPMAPTTTPNLALKDNDYFRFETSSKGTALDKVRIEFDGEFGDLSLALYRRTWDAATASWKYTLLTSVQTVGNSEEITLNKRPAGVYIVHVYGASGAKNPSYDLLINPP